MGSGREEGRGCGDRAILPLDYCHCQYPDYDTVLWVLQDVTIGGDWVKDMEGLSVLFSYKYM